MATTVLLGACENGTVKNSTDENLIGRSEIQVTDGRMTPEALWAMGRIGGYSLSPNGKKIVYTVSYYSVEQDKGNSEVFVMNADGSDNQQITHTPFSESGVAWIKGGSKIAFLCGEGGSSQVWEMNPDGTDRRKLSEYNGNIEGFAFSPDEKKVVFIAQIKSGETAIDKNPDLPKTTGIIVDDLMYKHWDEWVTTIPHPFVADFDGNTVSNPVDIMEGEPYESPMKPFGGIEQLAWSPASDQIAYTSRKKTGLEYAISTNSDIYIYDLKSGETTNISEGMMGYDTNPQYSPDGKSIAWLSMEHDGYESDQNRLMVMNLESGEKTFASKAFESSVTDFCWSQDAGMLYFSGVWHGESHIHQIDLKNNNAITQLTKGVYDYASVSLGTEGNLLAKRHSMSESDDIFAVALEGDHQITQLTAENKAIFDKLEMGKVEARWMKTTDGKQMLTWVIYPPHFDPNKKYPTLLFCQGGPQSPISQYWSYRWNFQMMAANDYIVVAPNRRGLPGFGLEWNEAISGDYGGQCMKDYFTAIDEKCNISKQKRCGLPTGIWAEPIGKRTTQQLSAHLLTLLTCSLTNGILQSCVSTEKRTIVSWPTMPWQHSMRLSCAVFLLNC